MCTSGGGVLQDLVEETFFVLLLDMKRRVT